MTAETDKAALREGLRDALAQLIDPFAFALSGFVLCWPSKPQRRAVAFQVADALLAGPLSDLLAQAEVDRAEIERLKAVLDFEKRARRVAEARADRLAAEVEAHEGVMKGIKAWIDTDLPAGMPGAGTAHMAISKALARAADNPGERTDSSDPAPEGRPR